MDLRIPEEPFRLVVDDRDDFVEAVSICAELETVCGSSGALNVMAFVGLARCEITEYGSRLSAHVRPVTIVSVHSGLDQLSAVITDLLREADDLAHVLRLHEARQFIEDARTLAV